MEDLIPQNVLAIQSRSPFCRKEVAMNDGSEIIVRYYFLNLCVYIKIKVVAARQG